MYVHAGFLDQAFAPLRIGPTYFRDSSYTSMDCWPWADSEHISIVVQDESRRYVGPLLHGPVPWWIPPPFQLPLELREGIVWRWRPDEMSIPYPVWAVGMLWRFKPHVKEIPIPVWAMGMRAPDPSGNKFSRRRRNAPKWPTALAGPRAWRKY